MSLLTRTYSFTDGTVAYGSQVEVEFANIVNTLNSLDQGNTTWTNVKVTTLLPQGDVAMGGHKITGLANGTAATDAVAYGQISSVAIVTGSVIMYPLKAAPSGYLYCDGSQVSRGTYATLYGIIGNAFGSGDGATTFHLPDYRGKFIRGVNDSSGNDPDAASRTAQASGGNSGDAAGSIQAGGNASHTHTATVTEVAHGHSFTGYNAGGVNAVAFTTPGNNTAGTANLNNSVGGNTTGLTVANSTTGGNEARPINAGLYFHIKI